MCAALLTFVCMLRYSEWNVVPIWFLYSSVLMVVRCADLAPVLFNVYDGTLCRSTIWFWDSSVLMVVYCANLAPVLFNIYGGTLCRSGFWIPRYLWWYAVPIWFLDSGFFDVSLMFSLMFASVPYSGFFLSAGSVSQRKVSLDHIPPDQCHLPLASLSILLTKPQKHPRLHPPSDTTFLWRPSTTSIHTKKARHLHIPKTPDSHQSYISWK